MISIFHCLDFGTQTLWSKNGNHFFLWCIDLEQALQHPAVKDLKSPAVAAVVGKKAPGAVEQKPVSDAEQKVASNVEVNTTPTGEDKAAQKSEEESSLPKCIGPGCENNAQPDSVYCGNDCILRHAAAAMKSITDDKEPKQKDKAKSETAKSTAKVTWITYQTVVRSCEWTNQRCRDALQVSQCF